MPNENKVCPFLNDFCRTDCVFHTHRIAVGADVFTCLIAAKLSDINPHQYDQVTDIAHILDR